MYASPARSVLLVCAAIVLSACVTGGGLREASLGPEPATVTALNGGLISQTQAIDLPAAAARAALDAEYQALQFGRVGLPVRWEAGGFLGEVTPTQLYRVGSQDCRGYSHVVTRGSASVREIGSACREGALWTPIA